MTARATCVAAAAALILLSCEAPDVMAPLPDDHVRGPATARVTVVEYGDYQCPPCSNTHRDLEGLLEKYPLELRLVFRHLWSAFGRCNR